jgi:hypothetical protein
MANNDYGFGLIAYSDSDGLLHFDLSTFGDGDPRVAQTDDLMCLFANAGDYDWSPCYTLGSGLFATTKGKPVIQQVAQSVQAKIDGDSMSDERITNSTTQVSITSNGNLRCNHTIYINQNESYSSDISIGNKGNFFAQLQ